MLRWEDELSDTRFTDDAPELKYGSSVRQGDLAVGIWAACEVVDWLGRGAQDLLVSCWESCYEGGAYIYLSDGRNPDGTPRLLPGEKLPGVIGFVSAAPFGTQLAEPAPPAHPGPISAWQPQPFGGAMCLIAAARSIGQYLVYPDLGPPGKPRIGAPAELETVCGPATVKGLPARIVACDLDRDGDLDLVIATDFWDDYWPDRKGWNDPAYRPYDAAGHWRGGPLRGHVYWLRNLGSTRRPMFALPQMLRAGGRPLEVYGNAAPAFADFRGAGRPDLVCGDFLDRLHFFPATDKAARFGPGSPLRSWEEGPRGELVMPQNIHSGCAADWDGDGRPDLLMGAEDGYVYFCRNAGCEFDGVPAFHDPVRVQQTSPRLNAGAVPIPAAGDLNGDGLPDLVVGNAAGHLLHYRNIGAPGRPRFDREVYLRAGGEVIRIQAGHNGSIQGPSEAKWGYTNPLLFDWDGDGLLDLLVSDVFGHHTWYRNIGSRAEPEFARGVKLRFRGRPLKTVWRVRPAVGDLFGGGLSYICLDEEGLLAAYARASETKLADKILLRFADGRPVAFTEDYGGGRGRIKLCLCDWTGNGLPDLLAGVQRSASVPPGAGGIPRHDIYQATVLLLENVGRPGAPAFAPPRYLLYRGKPLRLGMHSCAPQVVDWGDGVCGLIVGAESGTLLDLRREHLSW